jgi:hypothetical protein
MLEPSPIIRYSLFYSFFFDYTGRFSGQRRRLYVISFIRKSSSTFTICNKRDFISSIDIKSQQVKNPGPKDLALVFPLEGGSP